MRIKQDKTGTTYQIALGLNKIILDDVIRRIEISYVKLDRYTVHHI